MGRWFSRINNNGRWLALAVLASLTLQCLWSENPIPSQGLDLRGSWLLHSGDNLAWAAKGPDLPGWEPVVLPTKQLMPAGSKGWFWLRRNLDLASIPQGAYSMVIGELMNADQVWVNGEFVGSTGSPPPRLRSGWNQFRSYTIPEGTLQAGSNTVAIRVWHDSESWISGPLAILPEEQAGWQAMVNDILRIELIKVMFSLMLFIGFIFFYYWFKRKDVSEYLFFSLAVVCQALAMLPQFSDKELFWAPLSSNLSLAIGQSGMLLFPAFFSLFVIRYLHDRVRWFQIAGLLAPPAIAAVLMLSGHAERAFILAVRTPMLLTIPCYLALIMGLLIRGHLRQDRRCLAFLLAFIPVVFMALHDLLSFGLGLFEDGFPLYVYGMPLLFLMFTTRFIAQAVNVQLRNEQLERLLEEAQIDPLTGFNTRRSFEDMLKVAFNHAERYGDRLVIAIMDIDGLKRVNDSHGHAAGDELIRRVAAQLDHARRKVDLMSRYGGDEFMAVYFGGRREVVAQHLEAALVRLADDPLDLSGKRVTASFSYGLASYPEDGKDSGRLMAVADGRLYRMKAARKSGELPVAGD